MLCMFKWHTATEYNFIVTFLPLKKIKKNPTNENTVKLQQKYLLYHFPQQPSHTHCKEKVYSDANQLLGVLLP